MRFPYRAPINVMESKCLKSIKREREWTMRRNSSVTGQFQKQANLEFQHLYGKYHGYLGKAVVQYESYDPALEEDKSDLGQVILLRLIYVIQSERGRGVTSGILRTIVKIAEYTACCVISVSNPFERWVLDLEEKTVDVAKDFNNNFFAIESLRTDYTLPQMKMDQRFKIAGFQQVDISESIYEKKRCSPEHCWIYIPESCDGQFKRDIHYRILNLTMN